MMTTHDNNEDVDNDDKDDKDRRRLRRPPPGQHPQLPLQATARGVEMGYNGDGDNKKAQPPHTSANASRGGGFVLFSVTTGPALAPNARGGHSYYVYLLI